MTDKGFVDEVVVGFWEQQFYGSGGCGWWEWQVRAYKFKSWCHQMYKSDIAVYCSWFVFYFFWFESMFVENWKMIKLI